MVNRSPETLSLGGDEDVVRARRAVREWAARMGFSLVVQTKVVTAASELARNAIVHGGGGTIRIETADGAGSGLRLIVEDRGPGIADIDRALADGFSTAGGLGLGLGGSRRLVTEFEVRSAPGEGTRVTVVVRP
ncbi:MAG: anti-sigma regulatory factor [Acidobacteriota bacterium]